MKNTFTAPIIALGILLGIAVATPAHAVTLTPNPADLYDLDHGYYYTWNINQNLNPGETVTAATLTFTNITNWDNQTNTLYIQLLDDVVNKFMRNGVSQLGVFQKKDSVAGQHDFFEENNRKWPDSITNPTHILIAKYSDTNGSSTTETLSYAFNAQQLTDLTLFMQNGYFALGFDPDCHFYNDGITFTYTTSTIPEPGSILLFATGLLGAFGARRKQNA